MTATVHSLPVVDYPDDMPRPKTRGECVDGIRPCPWATCRWHLSHHTKDRFADLDSMPETCTLDVADRGGATFEDVASVMGVVRERVRQIEAKALERVTRQAGLAKSLEEFADYDRSEDTYRPSERTRDREERFTPVFETEVREPARARFLDDGGDAQWLDDVYRWYERDSADREPADADGDRQPNADQIVADVEEAGMGKTGGRPPRDGERVVERVVREWRAMAEKKVWESMGEFAARLGMSRASVGTALWTARKEGIIGQDEGRFPTNRGRVQRLYGAPERPFRRLRPVSEPREAVASDAQEVAAEVEVASTAAATGVAVDWPERVAAWWREMVAAGEQLTRREFAQRHGVSQITVDLQLHKARELGILNPDEGRLHLRVKRRDADVVSTPTSRTTSVGDAIRLEIAHHEKRLDVLRGMLKQYEALSAGGAA